MADPPRVVEGVGPITEILTSPLVAPPVRPGPGATLALHRAMARFAGPDRHDEPRRAVERAVARIDPEVLVERAAGVAQRWVAARGGGPVDAVRLAAEVPVVALGAAMGLVDPGDERAAARLVDDVDAVAAVIGRGGPSSATADRATARLLELAAGHPAGPVAAVSLLYQCLDATAALIVTMLDATVDRPGGGGRVPAVPRTVRTVLAPGVVAGREVAFGQELVLELGPAGLEFGAGPHACPGRGLAEALAGAVVTTVGRAGLVVDPGRPVARDADGRPRDLWLHVPEFPPSPAGGTGERHR